MTNPYKKAYTEVLEIIKYFPDEEYSKIPTEKINYYKDNMDKDYNFQINPNIELEKQHISKETNAILVTLFNDYFATNRQKEVLNNLLKQNQQELEKQKNEKYNESNLFKQSKIKQHNIVENKNETSLIEIKENFFTKFINFIKNLFKREK